MTLFASGGRDIENFPPTQNALLQHVKCAALQVGHVWCQSMLATPCVPSPSDLGWIDDGELWSPCWMIVPDA